MDKKIYQEQIKKLIEILKHYQPEKMILFGSATSGKFHPRSDIDICLIKRFKNSILDEKRKILALLWKYDYDYSMDPDIHLYKPSRFKRELKRNHPFFKEIVKGKDVDISVFNTKEKAKEAICLAREVLNFIDRRLKIK